MFPFWKVFVEFSPAHSICGLFGEVKKGNSKVEEEENKLAKCSRCSSPFNEEMSSKLFFKTVFNWMICSLSVRLFVCSSQRRDSRENLIKGSRLLLLSPLLRGVQLPASFQQECHSIFSFFLFLETPPTRNN